MELVWLALGGIDLLLIYYFFGRRFVLARKPFSCKRCGFCCRLRVKPTADDVARIETAGYKKEDFLDALGNLKRNPAGFCTFFKFEDGLAACTIQNAKPKLCAGWPENKIFGIKYNDARCSQYKGKLI